MSIEKAIQIAQEAISQRDKALEKCQILEKQNAELGGKVSELTKQLDALKDDYSRLQLARAYGWSEEAKKEAYRRISGLIRDIDSCLNMLK